jgi:hypothetical protein
LQNDFVILYLLKYDAFRLGILCIAISSTHVKFQNFLKLLNAFSKKVSIVAPSTLFALLTFPT